MTVSWRVVRSLTTLRLQVNAAYPGRATGADGTIGDAAHMAESNSDHDPHYYAALGSTAVVCALDITHDPAHGADTYAMAEALRQSRDPRIGYLISNRRITGPNHGWKWDVYTGTSDPHTGHMHVSSVHTGLADDESPWHFLPGAVLTSVVTPNPTPLPEDPVFFLALAASGQYYLCDGMRSVPVTTSQIADLRTLRNEGLIQVGKNALGQSTLEFPRTGWTPSFGPVDAPATVDVKAVAAALAPLLPAGATVDVAALAAALAPHLPAHITLTGTVAP